MTSFFDVLIGGVFHASVLFLVAAGLQLVFGVQRIVNLACGSFYALGAYFGISAVTWTSAHGAPPWTFLPVLIGAGVLLGSIGPPIERLWPWNWATIRPSSPPASSAACCAPRWPTPGRCRPLPAP